MVWVLYLSIIGILFYELKAAIGGHDRTISEIVWAASSRPMVPFLFGLLMGHFFWQK